MTNEPDDQPGDQKNTKLEDPGEPDRKNRSAPGAAWIAIGLGVGIAIGVALDNIGIGIAIGAGVGVAMMAAQNGRSKKDK